MAKRRKRGSGSVRLRKDGRWEGRAVTGYDDKGLPKTKNVLAKTKRECEEKLKEEAGVTSRCMPFAQEKLSDTCVYCGKPAAKMVYWGKAY